MKRVRIYQFSTAASVMALIVLAVFFWSVRPFSGITLPMADCQNLTTPVKIIRVFFPSIPMGPTPTPRDVEWADYSADIGVLRQADSIPVPTSKLDYKDRPKAPFHIDLSKATSPLNLSVGDYVMIRVVLQDSVHYSFCDKNCNGVHGVGISDPKHSNMCGALVYPSNGGYPGVAVFYARVKIPGSRVLDPEPYNIAVEVAGNDDTPIFIDPKVKNPG